jgi:hypothetical protein
MRMTRLALISTLLITGLVAARAAIRTAHEDEPPRRSPAPTEKVARKADMAGPEATERTVKRFGVRVIDASDRSIPNVEVKLVEEDAIPRGGGLETRTATYRTGADGRVRIAVDARFRRLVLEARPDDRTFGWASLDSGNAWLKANDDSPITLTVLPLNHHAEGTIVDSRGKPIRGVLVRVMQLRHEANGFSSDPSWGEERASLGPSITDEAGRYRFDFPADTDATFLVYHPRFFGPIFSCGSDQRTIPPLTMEDAGAIAGTVVDVATDQPVEGARVAAQCVELANVKPGGWMSAVSDAEGRFLVGGLAPAVYNLLLQSSPKGPRFTARAVEGVRVQVGREARADLRMIEGRRLHGTAIFAATGEPVVGEYIMCYNASHPLSGAACQSSFSDDRGRFELFVPPGPVFVYINASAGPGSAAQKRLVVPEDRDPDPVLLKRGLDPNAPPAPRPVFCPPPKCEVRVRVRTDPGERPAPGQERTLSGRLFEKNGSPLPAVRISGVRTPTEHFEAATDRLGVFRMKGLPPEEVRLGVYKDGDYGGEAVIPAGAVEVDLILP